MSMTASVGVVGAGHWSYMAKELARVICRIISQRRIEVNSVPATLYADATGFFQLIEQYVGNDVPVNPPASANAYMIAKRAIRRDEPRAVIKQTLEESLSFFKKLRDAPSELDEEQLKRAASLQRFLLQLYREGQSETYEKRVRFKERVIA